VQLLCENLHKQYLNKEAKDIQTAFLAFTGDTICKYMFQESWGYQHDKEKAEEFRRIADAIALVTPIMKQFPWLMEFGWSIPISLIRPILPDLAGLLELHKRAHQSAVEFLADETNQSVEASKSYELPPSLFYGIVRSSIPPQEKSFERLAQEAFVFLFAGSDTSSHALSHALYYLVANSTVLERLRQELSTVMPNPKFKPELKVLEGLPFFTAVIRESLRTMSLITSRTPLVAPEDDLKYGDWIIPAKTPVSMTINDVLKEPTIFPDPDKFLPDRWLEDGKLHNKFNQYWFTFGRGPRMCQGMDFAWAEFYFALAAVVMRFDFELYDTTYERDIKFVKDCFFGQPGKSSKGIRMKVVSDAVAS